MPVIADFESVNTLSRWEIKHVSRFEIDNQFYTQGLSSVLVEFEKAKYPNISLESIYPDWSAYELLNLSIHNDQNEDLEMTVKVYDWQHYRSEMVYNDRFNRKITLSSSWNELKIKLSDIHSAPRNRHMNQSEIAGFSLFVHEPERAKVIHLDNIRLSK